jgi:alkylation response protein AidB-like acyl-CoA dehydrogenase
LACRGNDDERCGAMNLSADQRLLAETVREVLAKHAPIDRTRSLATEGTQFDAELWQRLSELGWSSLLVPEKFGGIGLGLPEAAVVARELGRGAVGTPLLPTLTASFVIARYGSHDQQAAWLPEIASGDMRIAMAFGTPDDIRVRVYDRATRWLSGSVRPVADAESVTHVLVPFDGESSGVALLAIETVSADPLITIDLTRGYSEITVEAAELTDAWTLPAAAHTAGFDALVTLQCAESLGAAEQLLDMTVAYLGQREQFGRQIGTFQALQHRCADMAIELAGSRAAVEHAAARCAIDATDTAEAVSVAAAWVGPGASWIAGESLQLHGGIGFTWEHNLHIYLRRIKANELVLGTPRWHRERIMSEVFRGR